MGRAGVAATGAVVLGVLGVVAAVLADLGRWPYYGGAVLVVIGVVLVLRYVLSRPAALVAAGTVVAGAVLGGAWLGLHGPPTSHDSWPDDVTVRIDADGARRDGVWFTGTAALDQATGESLWSAEDDDQSSTGDSRVIALTKTTVVSSDDDTVVARDVSDGTEQWSATFGHAASTAVDGHVLVVTSSAGTAALDLRTGTEVWSSSDASATRCALGRLRPTGGPAPTQGVVLLAEQDDRRVARSVRAVRVSDGRVVVDDVPCLLAARGAGDTLVHTGESRADGTTLVGRSGRDGHVLWRTTPDQPLQRAYALSGGDAALYVPGPYEHTSGTETIPTYSRIDVRSGRIDAVRPPSDWLVIRDETRDQVTPHLWQPVVRADGGLGLWEVGSDRVVQIPGSSTHHGLSTTPGGWATVYTHAIDAVGDVRRQHWVVSPEGELFGPFSGGSVRTVDGLVVDGGTVHPLGR